MSRLFLHCAFCGRKQADGLLSRNSWGHVRAADGTTLMACPGCKATDTGWESRLLATAGPAASSRESGPYTPGSFASR